MGFLDHSTNNIIIDAVLTDYGRRLLAENQGSFKIKFFSLGDDEIDYTTIRKFGRTVGKEKISKNTPIFEAQTASSLAMKHRLITLPDPMVTLMPSMRLVPSSVGSGGTIDGANLGPNSILVAATSETVSMSFEQQISQGAVPAGLSDQTYTIFVNDRFLEVTTATRLSTQPNSRIAAYTQTKSTSSAGDVTNASGVTLTIRRKTLDSTTFNQFGDFGNKNNITTVLSVVGDQSGLRTDIKVTIQNASTTT